VIRTRNIGKPCKRPALSSAPPKKPGGSHDPGDR
jgi:hypothetical protein